MKLPVIKGVLIVGVVIGMGCILAYLANSIAVQKALREKNEAFLRNGIDVAFEDRRMHVQPINLKTFSEDVRKGLTVPEIEKRSASLIFAKNQTTIQPEQIGIALNTERLIEDLHGRIETYSTVAISAETATMQPEVTEEDLQKVLPVLIKKNATLFTLTSKNLSVPIRFHDHLDWIEYRKKVDSLTGEGQIVAEVLQQPLSAYIEKELGDKVRRPAATVKISRGGDGKVIFDGHGKNGLVFDAEKFRGSLEQVVNTPLAELKDTKIELPITESDFLVEISPDLQQLGVTQVIAIGHTSYYGSPKNRMANIDVGVGRYNGLLIAPGEVFSFNEKLGPVDGAHGFLKELVIKPEGTIPEFGGGLCQVSTTAYRGALYAGLPIIERSPHSYAVGYYSQIGGHGIDATIYPGARDLRFKNDTPGSILLQAYTEGSEVYFIYYGTSDGRQVKLEGPMISNRNSIAGADIVETDTLPPGVKKTAENAHMGLDTLWYRYITLPDGLTSREEIKSRYRAVRQKTLVGVTKVATETPAVGTGKAFAD